MTSLDEIRLELSVALDVFVRATIDIIPMRRAVEGSRQPQVILNRKEQITNNLLRASSCDGDNLEDLRAAIVRTLSVMDDIWQEMTGPTERLVEIMKKTAELGSILRLAHAHPESALRRAKGITGKFISRAKVAA